MHLIRNRCTAMQSSAQHGVDLDVACCNCILPTDKKFVEKTIVCSVRITSIYHVSGASGPIKRRVIIVPPFAS